MSLNTINFLTESHWVRRKVNRKGTDLTGKTVLGACFSFCQLTGFVSTGKLLKLFESWTTVKGSKVNENMKNIFYNSGFYFIPA